MAGIRLAVLVVGVLSTPQAWAQQEGVDKPKLVVPRQPDEAVSATILPPPAKPKPQPPRPARQLTVHNASSLVVEALGVTGDGLGAKLAGNLLPGATATLRLPAFRSCKVAVSLTLEGASDPDTFEQNICHVRVIRVVGQEPSPAPPPPTSGERSDEAGERAE